MKKFLLSLVVIFSFGLYAFLTPSNRPGAIVSVNSNPAPVQSSPSLMGRIFNDEEEGVSLPAPTPVQNQPSVPPSGIGQYKDGSYVGDLTDAYYGNVQVKAVVQGSKLADVVFLQYPSDRNTSVQINTAAMPQLKSEAIQAQSAQVDAVSGATQTSRAFTVSLASALAQAKK